MTNYPELASVEEIKENLPVTYVLWKFGGLVPEQRSGRDLRYVVPWRQDSNPSLACYADEDGGTVNRWKDMARGDGSDVFDLIGNLDPRQETFADRLALARRIYDAYRSDTDWVAPEPLASTSSFDVDAARAELDEWALRSDTEALGRWMAEREDAVSSIPPAWLSETFGVCWAHGEVKAPYYDQDRNLVAYKYRRPGEKFKSASGTRGRWTIFYGEWLDTDEDRPVVLCEGEPDVWAGTYASQDHVFLGLPSGAGTRPEKMRSRLAGRRILIALDGDEAGRAASLLWAQHLAKDNDVEVVPVPEGKDLASVTDIPALLRKARRYEAPLRGLLVVGGRYRRATKDDAPGMELSDFVLVPTRVMQSETGALSYEVQVNGKDDLILTDDLVSKNSMRRWASARGLVWTGNDTDVALLASRLKSESIFCPQEGASDIAGLFEGHIVWDGGSIGDSPVRYVPTASKVRLDIRVSDGRPDLRLVRAMRELNDHAVTDPILAWAAAAPFRSLLPQFPVLNVSGTSGSGKTTTVQAIIPTLTGSHIFQTLSSSTPYGVESLINSTNGFPVVFDEYRPGARDGTLVRLEQLARDAYDGYPSAKSAGGDRWNEIAYVRTLAPIVISGEQSITETSHAERMIIVRLVRPKQRDPRHQRALEHVRAHQDGTLAHAFLTHVVQSVAGGSVRCQPEGPKHLPDRVRWNLGVLDLGWRILEDFVRSPLGEPDWSGVIETLEGATASNPTVEALMWAVGDEHASRNVWITDKGELCVAVAGFVADVQRNGTIVLPGNNGKTISDQLQADYGARPGKRVPPLGSVQKRVWIMPAERVFPPDELD